MSRNYGIGSRDMLSAAHIVLHQGVQRGELSFSSAATIEDRFRILVTELKKFGIGRLENVTHELIVRFGQGLADDVENGDMSASYAQNIVSAANTVMYRITQGEWKSVSPTKECLISQRSLVRQKAPTGLDLEQFKRAIESVEKNGWNRAPGVRIVVA